MPNIKKFLPLIILIFITVFIIIKKKKAITSKNKLIDSSVKTKEATSPTNLINNRDTKYETETEIINFFKNQGLEYSKFCRYDIDAKDFQNMEKTDYLPYLENSEVYEELTEKYESFIKEGYIAPIYIKWVSDEIGYGVYASTDIPKNTMIGVYVGDITPKDKIDNKIWSWKYPSKGSFIDKYNTDMSVNAAKFGNELRFINHGDDPELGHPNISPQILYADKKWLLVYVANRYIKKDEELLVSYGSRYWRTKQRLG